MIAVTVTMKIRQDMVAECEQTARELEEQVRVHEPGCIVYRMSKSRTDPLTYYNFEIFRDQAALDEHTAAAYFQAALPRLGPCQDGTPVVDFADTIV